MPIYRKTRLVLALMAASSLLYACGGGDVAQIGKDAPADQTAVSDKARIFAPPGGGAPPSWPPRRADDTPIDGTPDLGFADQKDGISKIKIHPDIFVNDYTLTDVTEVIPVWSGSGQDWKYGFLVMVNGGLIKIDSNGKRQPFLEKSFKDLGLFGSRMQRLSDGSIVFTGVMANYQANIARNPGTPEKRAVNPNGIQLSGSLGSPRLTDKNVPVVGKLTPEGKIDVNFGQNGFYPLGPGLAKPWPPAAMAIRVLGDGSIVTTINYEDLYISPTKMLLTHLDATGKKTTQLGGQGQVLYSNDNVEPKRDIFPAVPAGYFILPQMQNKNEIIMTGCHNHSIAPDDSTSVINLMEIVGIDLVSGDFYDNGVVGSGGRTGELFREWFRQGCDTIYRKQNYGASTIDGDGNIMIHTPVSLEKYRQTPYGLSSDPDFDPNPIQKWASGTSKVFVKFGVQPDGKIIAGTMNDLRTRFLSNGALDTTGSYAAHGETKFTNPEAKREAQFMVPMPQWNYEFSVIPAYNRDKNDTDDTYFPFTINIQRQHAKSLCPLTSAGLSAPAFVRTEMAALKDVEPSTYYVSGSVGFTTGEPGLLFPLWIWSGEWSKDDGKTWSNMHGMVKEGDLVRFRVLSSQTPGATASVETSLDCYTKMLVQFAVTTRK